MKIFNLLMGGGLILLLVSVFVFGSYNLFAEDDLFENQAFLQLISIAESKADRVEKFLKERKEDSVFLADSDDVRSVFDEELIRDVGLMREKIIGISRQTAEDIEEYLVDNPGMTLEDLKKDKFFQKVAVRRIGETGYTHVVSRPEGVAEFHPDPKVRGTTYYDWRGEFSLIWGPNNEIATSVPCVDSYGFYDWRDIDGNVREKFVYYRCINEKTADNVSLYVGASTYLDEYGGSIDLAYDLNLELISFQRKKGYADLILINYEGDVIWTAKRSNELGTNLVDGVYNESLLADVFNKVKEDLTLEVSDSEVYGFGGSSVFVVSPVFDIDSVAGEDVLIGMIALRLDSERIADLLVSNVGLGEKGEVYIVNKNGRYISPLKFADDYEEVVMTDRARKCFEDYYNDYFSLGEYFGGAEKAGKGLNYAGMDVFGAHAYILESGWCIIAEMNVEDFFEDVSRGNEGLIIATVVLFICGFVVSIVLAFLYKIKKVTDK